MTPRADIPEITTGIVAALAAHAILVGIILFANFGPEEAHAPVVLPVLETELLMLGEQMPEEGMLPRMANPEEAPQDSVREVVEEVPEETALPDQETVVIEREPEPEPEVRPVENRPDPTPRPREEAAERQDRGETNPHRPTNDDPTTGSREGFAGGTSLSATAVANQLAPISAQIGRAVRRPASIPEAEFRSLSCSVSFRVSELGRVLPGSWDIERSSGNRLFDAAVQNALNSFSRGSSRLQLQRITNADLRSAVIRRGFEITIRGR